MKKFACMCLIALFCLVPYATLASPGIEIYFENQPVMLEQPPMIVQDYTLVSIRSIANAMNCDVTWDDTTKSVRVEDDQIAIRLYPGKTEMNVFRKQEMITTTLTLDVAATIENDRVWLPLRGVAEAFGLQVTWQDGGKRTIHLSRPAYREQTAVSVSRGGNVDRKGKQNTFYFQNEAKWELPNYGSGYCWVCSYAMLLTDVTGKTVTPNDVAKVNLTKTENGAYCYHYDIIAAFDAQFVCALDQNSPLLDWYDPYFGATYLNNPNKEDAIAIAAIKQALDRNPAGVMVRFADYPHTVVAVAYEGDVVYYNDPAQQGREYAESSTLESVPFERTVMAYKQIPVGALTFLQAIESK